MEWTIWCEGEIRVKKVIQKEKLKSNKRDWQSLDCFKCSKNHKIKNKSKKNKILKIKI